MSSLFESFVTTPEVSEALADRAVIEAMLRVEAALARAQSGAGLLPQGTAMSIMGTCKVELFDVPKLVRESASARCLATPLVASLRETVALFNPEAVTWVHFGCSDQELVDTALVLLIRDVLKLIQADLDKTIDLLLTLALRHKSDAMVARSPLHAASITSFGLTCSQWAAPLVRSQQQLQAAADQALRLHLGSSVTTLADMQGKGPQVMSLMATDLQLNAPAFAGNDANDDTVALACALGLLTGNLGKIALEIAYMAQFELGELTQVNTTIAAVPGAKPVPPVATSLLCMVAQVAAQRVPQQVAVLLASLSQQHANAPGNWQTQLVQWPALLAASQSITCAVAQLVAGLQADTQRMRTNLEAVRTSLHAKEDKARFSNDLLKLAAEWTRSQIKALRRPQ
ncbi:lyase family protein [Rhodoferax sp.]|uniref:lyase family protein n=1 Tax=Rhodoferax sp. TaxID=50421 RepID=UPI002715B43E|nr:lyase family protein [Rhodoferax sp.]MDO9145191.1 lyase family protein [Rhodoferax sp.]